MVSNLHIRFMDAEAKAKAKLRELHQQMAEKLQREIAAANQIAKDAAAERGKEAEAIHHKAMQEYIGRLQADAEARETGILLAIQRINNKPLLMRKQMSNWP